MAKANKSTVARRTNEVLRLILAGGEFEDIRQYSAAQGWGLSERQLWRYQEDAHQKLVEALNRDQKQLLGRHLMQRRALYARAVKINDVRTALAVLRDEALLQGLYPQAKNGTAGEAPGHPLLAAPPPISREERLKRLLAAEAQGDEKEQRLMEHLTPTYSYALKDTAMPRMLLHIMALMYVADQLDHAAMYFFAVGQIEAKQDPNGTWDYVGGIHAYRYKVECDGWELFTQELGIDGQKLVTDNHQGSLLQLIGDRLYAEAPTSEVVAARLAEAGQGQVTPTTGESIAKGWRAMLREVLTE